jgi:hypothetical protein
MTPSKDEIAQALFDNLLKKWNTVKEAERANAADLSHAGTKQWEYQSEVELAAKCVGAWEAIQAMGQSVGNGDMELTALVMDLLHDEAKASLDRQRDLIGQLNE